MAYRRMIMNLQLLKSIRYFMINKPELNCRTFSAVSASPFVMLKNCAFLCIEFNISQNRHYAKGKDKVKNSAKNVEIREDMLAEYINVKKFKTELEDTLQKMKEQYIQNVSLRSSAGTIEALQVEFEGEKYTIRDLAQINRKNPKLIALNFCVFPQTIPTVLQVLNESGMNLNPQQDGTNVYIPIPKVTREHRESLAKNANGLLNKLKTVMRDIQSRYLKKLEAKQDEGLSKDLYFNLKDQLTQMTNNCINQAEKIRDDKVKELLRES